MTIKKLIPVEEAMHRELKEYATENGMKLQEVISRLLADSMKRLKVKKNGQKTA